MTATVTGSPAEPELPVDLSAFRIAQEALTNALKHGGPPATVCVEYRPAEVRLEIVDAGAARPAGPAGRPAARLVGMRERVAIFGGELAAGPRPGGGFRRRSARLPLTREPS